MKHDCLFNFTVTKKGTIADIKLMSTSGYTSVDKKLINLITSLNLLAPSGYVCHLLSLGIIDNSWPLIIINSIMNLVVFMLF